jgi:6-phosphogluconolactonase
MLKTLIIASIVFLNINFGTNGQPPEVKKASVIEKSHWVAVTHLDEKAERVTDKENQEHQIFLYIGTYTTKKSKGIYLVGFDTVKGMATAPKLVAAIDNPSFQWISADQKQLWSVSEGDKGSFTGFEINRQNGALKKLKTYDSKGSAPCFITYDNVGNSVLAANYSSGNVIRLAVRPDGTSCGDMAIHQHKGSGPVVDRQSSPHAHSIKIDLIGRYAYSCDLGADKIYVYDLSQPDLYVDTIIQDAPGSGPRHIAFHPGRKAMSVIHELNNMVSTYLPDQKGRFTLLQSVMSTLPSDFSGKSFCADIHYSADGRFLYASNRGHNSIVIFKVDQQTMKPDAESWVKEDIHWPRNFIIDPSGNFLLVANQKADDITIYKIDRATGLLTYTGHKILVSAPVCLTWLKD